MFDIVGDIHGHADVLKALLRKMDYAEVDGVWRHPSRQLIFVGDLIDRGPAQIEVVQIVRRMVEAGCAHCVMGNHEFNAISWATPDPLDPGEFLRPHRRTENQKQHREFLTQVGEGSSLHHDMLDWFRTLPLFLDLPALRVVHACWHPALVALSRDWIDGRGALLPRAYEPAARAGSDINLVVEALLKGVEAPLPAGHSFLDKDGHRRHEVRVKWWDQYATTYKTAALMSDEELHALPDLPISDTSRFELHTDKPVFFGHYWFRGEPKPLNAWAICLDYSVARPKGDRKLCAYRFSGESTLSADSVVWIDADL